MLKKFIQRRLEKYVQKYFRKHAEVKLVVVTGSVGKTSTKRAIGTLLSQQYRVRMHEGNHNTNLSAPLAILGIDFPDSVKSISAWLAVFSAARTRIKSPTDVEVIIQELGSDHPGEIEQFGKYLRPDIAVVTAVSPEHMEFFGTIDAVAHEEMTVAAFSKTVLINRDDIDGRFAELLTNPNMNTYGTSGAAEYRFEENDFSLDEGYKGTVIGPELVAPLRVSIKVLGEHSVRPVLGAVGVALKLGVLPQTIVKGIESLKPVPGRMNLLNGIGGTKIIDDTYNSSPAALCAALQTLYTIDAPQRIALLGSMNELGLTSQAEHEEAGKLCDPNLLSWVVTVGDQAEKYLAPVARQRGCQVKCFKSAIDAGGFVRGLTMEGSVILVKGSQGGIYLEEAVKVLCDMSEDIELVRQSQKWMKIKDDFFSKFS